ncbi:potassium channel family protein [Alkalicoccus chagannorensis]|uniref:potassium channel family protein n=1 Tax=Alkalicoccus chagannorensis TaxID=427072 RepID=UPI0003F78045|nr:potassium channel family protein [Alkalicoccus chagannorensis]
MTSTVKIVYEIFLVLLILWSASTLFYEPTYIFLYQAVWIILLCDVLIRLSAAENKLDFVKRHPFDFIAAIPLDSIFQFARFVRLFRLLRVALLLKRTPIYAILYTNGLLKTLGAVGLLIFLSAIPITYLEADVDTFMDGVWWAVVTATTVGYGDIAPVTTTGRAIALLLMVFGIDLIGMVTSSIATYFLEKRQAGSGNDTAAFICSQLQQPDRLTTHDYDRLLFLLQSLKDEQRSETHDKTRG